MLTQPNSLYIYAAVSFCDNHPPAHRWGFAPKICPHPGAFASQLLLGGRGFVGIAPEAVWPMSGHWSINDFCHFWNFHKNGKNWRLTKLWGLLL